MTHRPRVDAVDVARGLIMILMALDHTRDFFGAPGADPTNLATATPALFLTRWITHLCAPMFFLLIGTGARLSLRKQSTAALSHFLVTRGVWLIVAEVTVARLAYQFNADYRVTLLLVLWAAGWCMLALAALVHLPVRVVVLVGLLIVGGHNLLDGVSLGGAWWTVLHGPGIVVNRPGFVVVAVYPVLPWIGVSALGYALGHVYDWERARRRRWLVRAGALACVAFLALRAINRYGDPSHWTTQPTARFTLFSFLNTTKYPPSLLYLLMTLGPALLLLVWVDREDTSMLLPALLIGRVPFFYYVVHFASIHAMAALVCLVRYGSALAMTQSPDLAHYPFSAPPGWGNTLPVVYGAWLLIVVWMYPLCRWYAGVKQRHPSALLSYL
jgi:uncharacterized membrane protein